MSIQEVEAALKAKNIEQIKTLLNKLISEQVPLANSKPAVGHLVNNISQLNKDQSMEVSNHAISLMHGGWQL